MFEVKKNLKLYKDDMLEAMEGVGHFFTTRFGGISGASGNLFNASFSRETDPESYKVRENAAIAAFAEDLPKERFTSVKQVHGDRVLKVTEEIAGARFGKPEIVIEADAMITDLPMTPLFTTHGDCLPVYIYAKGTAVGMAHSGWRGCALGIAGKTAAVMSREYGVSPKEMFCAVGPSICRKCFEIDEPVYRELREAFPDEALYTYNCVNNKYYADLGGMVLQSLTGAGVPQENISLGGVCTCCSENRELFFSYRGEKGKNEGLMGAAIWLR